MQCSTTLMTEIVIPNDTNSLGKLRGGRLIDWMDIAGEIAPQRHCAKEAVTASINQLNFLESINIGDIITMKSRVSKVNTTSMEVIIEVWSENISRKKKKITNKGVFIYVAIDSNGQPCKVPKINSN